MKKNLVLLFVILMTIQSYASHFIGGEITWECNSDPTSPDYGKYTFFLKIYHAFKCNMYMYLKPILFKDSNSY